MHAPRTLQVEEDEEGEGDEHSSLGIALEAFHVRRPATASLPPHACTPVAACIQVTLRSNESVVHVPSAWPNAPPWAEPELGSCASSGARLSALGGSTLPGGGDRDC